MIPPPPEGPPPEPARGSRLSGGLRRTIIAVVVVVIVLIGIIGYAVAGLAYAQTRLGNADQTLNTVISHQNSLNSTFKDFTAKFNGLSSSSSSFDPKQARTLVDQSIANIKSAGTTVDQDDTSLVSARANLSEQQWLTVFSRSSLDKETARIDHARKAISVAKTIVADYLQDGVFWQAYLDVATDLNTLGAQSATADLAGARTTLTSMKTHVDKSLQLTSAPGLPSELHDLMVDFESLVTDFGKLLDAAAAGDYTAITNAENGVQADANKISSYNLDTISAEFGAYYKPLFDSLNSEMAKATA